METKVEVRITGSCSNGKTHYKSLAHDVALRCQGDKTCVLCSDSESHILYKIALYAGLILYHI